MKTTSRSKLAAAFATICASGAIAQTDGTYLLISSNDVSLLTPTTTVEIWATWADPPGDYVFGGGSYTLIAGDGAFSNPVNVLNGPGSTTGLISGNVVGGARNGQIHLPITVGILGKRDNPILLATYDWTTTDFAPRSVHLDTSNTDQFVVAANNTGVLTSLYPNEFSPGKGVISVVPAPGAVGMLAISLVLGSARRTRHSQRAL